MNGYRSRNSKAGMLALGLALIGFLLFAGSLTSHATPPAPPTEVRQPCRGSLNCVQPARTLRGWRCQPIRLSSSIETW